MNKILVALSVALLMGCDSSAAYTSATEGARIKLVAEKAMQTLVSTQDPQRLTAEEKRATRKAMSIEVAICQNVYPAPSDVESCILQMTKEIDKKFPQARKKAEDAGLLVVPAQYAGEKEMIALAHLNARMIAECRTAKFLECMDGAYHVLLGAFDPHSAYFSAEEFADFRQSMSGSFMGIGAEVGHKRAPKDPLVVINPMEGSPAEKAGVLPGDLIVGISADGSETGMKPITAFKDATEAVKSIRGKKGTQVRIEVERAGETTKRVFVITRDVINTKMVTAEVLKKDSREYGLIQVKSFGDDVAMKVKKAYEDLERGAGKKLDGLIISVENNPGGSLFEVHVMLDLFLDAPSFVLTRDPGGIAPYQPCERSRFGIVICGRGITPQAGDITNGLPILVVVNGGSASASEIFAGSLQHSGRAVVAGTPTFQKGSVQSITPLDDGSAIKLMTAEFLIGTESDWIPVQCIGVVPDIVYDRDRDPKKKDGTRVTDCSLDKSIRSGGAMPGHRDHPAVKVANPALYRAGEAMLEAYKVRAAVDDAKRKEREKLLEQYADPEEE